MTLDEPGCAQGGVGERGRRRHEDEPGDRGPVTQPALQEDGDRHEQRVRGRVEYQHGQHREPEPTVAQQARREDGRAVPPLEIVLPPQEEPGDERRRDERQDTPQRPALLRPLDQRDHEKTERHAAEHDTGNVESLSLRTRRARQDDAAEERRAEADRQVNEEDHAPSEAGDVRVDERAAHDLPGDRAEPDRQTEKTEGAATLPLARAMGAQDGVDLGREDRRHGALGETGGHEGGRGGRDPAEHGSEGEADESH